jgi:hypothetical protein
MNPDIADSPQESLSTARRFLKSLQVIPSSGDGAFMYHGPDKTEATLQALHFQRQFVQTDDPKVVRRGVFKFNAVMEKERIALAEDLVRRTEPGSFEDPNYMALLAYQAASLEWFFLKYGKREYQDERSKVLLGTIHSADINAYANLSKSGYTIIVLNSGLVDFIYQAAKAVIESQNPVVSPNGGSAVMATTNLDEIYAGLKKNRAPINRVWKTLEAYFFNGYPRAFSNETVKEEHQPALSTLIAMAERWVIAHEYGHSLFWDLGLMQRMADDMDSADNNRPRPQNTSRAEEFFSDNNATIVNVWSASILDDFSPEFPLSGGIFALACLDILEKARMVLTAGEVSEDRVPSTHPPNLTRAQNIVNTFRQFFDVEYIKGRVSNLYFTLRREPPEYHAFSGERSQRVFLYAKVLFKIWEDVKEILKRQFLEKRPLHPMWQ